MTMLAQLIILTAKLLSFAINLYTYVIIIAALISWVNPDPYNPIVRILYRLTFPVFSRVRRLMPNSVRMLPIDISPIIVLIALNLANKLISHFLYQLAMKFLA